MKIELLVNLKASKLWKKGTVFDSTVAPIPSDIMKEHDIGRPTVRVIATEKPNVAVEPKTEIESPVPENVFENANLQIADAEKIEEEFETKDQAPEKLTIIDELERLITHYSSMRKLAKALGTSAVTVSKWRKGKNKPSKQFSSKIHRMFQGLSDDQR